MKKVLGFIIRMSQSTLMGVFLDLYTEVESPRIVTKLDVLIGPYPFLCFK